MDVVRWNVSNPDRLTGFLDGSFCRVHKLICRVAMHRGAECDTYLDMSQHVAVQRSTGCNRVAVQHRVQQGCRV